MSIVVGIHNDCFGCITGDETPEEEYNAIREQFADLTGLQDAKYLWIEAMHKLDNRPLDILVVDYGGLVARGALGMSGMVDAYHRQIQQFASDHPSTLIVFWSAMAVRDYAAYVDEEVEDLGVQYVVMVPYFKQDDTSMKKAVERIKVHLGVS